MACAVALQERPLAPTEAKRITDFLIDDNEVRFALGFQRPTDDQPFAGKVLGIGERARRLTGVRTIQQKIVQDIEDTEKDTRITQEQKGEKLKYLYRQLINERK